MTHPAKDGRTGRVERIIEVLRVLERERRITKARLYELLGVTSQSSFKRVKAELTRAGLPLSYNRDDAHFHLPESASVARYGIDARTRALLAQVRAAVAALGGPSYDALEDACSLYSKRGSRSTTRMLRRSFRRAIRSRALTPNSGRPSIAP
jgi:predicted DNA-binding transcriptional regulator YafY